MTHRDWFIDELSRAGSEHLEPDYVATYDQKAATDPTDDLAILRGQYGLDDHTVLVDMGAGTGTFALAAATYCRRVIAVDVSAQMLDVLRRKREAMGIASIETVEAGFLSYDHVGEPADIVYSRHALHHLPDFWKALALKRVRDMMRPGGVFMLRDLIYAFDVSEAEDKIDAWLDAAAASPELGWTREELKTHLAEEFSPFSWLLEPMLEQAGLRIDDVLHHGSIHSTYLCIRT